MTEPGSRSARTPRIVIVAALARDRTIGKDGGIPWRIPEDMAFFKRHTLGTAVVMGRKTFDTIGRALPGRDTIVITRDPARLTGSGAGVFPVRSFDEALALAATRGVRAVSIAGGAAVYEAALAVADEMLLTFVDHPGEGDVRFPAWDLREWEEAGREPVGPAVAVRYRRRTPGGDRPTRSADGPR